MTPKRIFRNPWPHPPHGLLDVLRWKTGRIPREESGLPDAPDTPALEIVLSAREIATLPLLGWRVTWFGHASFLLQGGGVSVLVDPVFSPYCAPLPFPGLRRLREPPCPLEDLPPIDVVLLTHSHYDHLDLPSLRKLKSRPTLVVPEGHAHWLGRAGFHDVIEVPWFASHTLAPGVAVTATPAQHFTARTPWNRNHAHWCGWLLSGAGCSLWHAGDSGYCEGFQEIGTRFGPIDFGMIPIGSYQPRQIMQAMHMNPEESVRVFLDSRCRRAVAMHWGTFNLTDEPVGEPPLLLAIALKTRGISPETFITGAIGQSWNVSPIRPS